MRCCLGFIANQVCGLNDEEIADVETPASARNTYGEDKPKVFKMFREKLPGFFFGSSFGNTKGVIDLMMINDSRLMNSSLREEHVVKTLAGFGIDVEFVD